MINNTNQNKIIFFDFIGTLMSDQIDWERENRKGVEFLFDFFKSNNIVIDDKERFGREIIDEKRIRRKKAKTDLIEYRLDDLLKEKFTKFNIDFNEDFVQQAVDAYIKPEIDICFPYEGAIDLLEALCQDNYKLALISNTLAKNFTELLVKKNNLNKYFFYILTSAEAGYRKPHEKFIEKFLIDTKAHVDNCVWIGDRLNDDIVGAKSIGMKNVFFSKDYHEDNIKHSSVVADFEVKNMRDLYKTIKEIYNEKN